MKKLTSFILLLSMICCHIIVCTSVSAIDNEYAIEGEKASANNFVYYNGGGVQPRTTASGGKAMMLLAPLTETNKSYYAEYQIEVDNKGVYEITMHATPPAYTWTSPLRVLVNDSEVVSLSMQELLEQKDPEIWVYRAGNLELQEGTNTLRFIIDEGRENDKNCVMWIDKIVLRETAQQLKGITTKQDWNVYEQGEKIEITFQAKSKIRQPYPIRYDVIDYYNTMVDSDTVYIQNGETETTVTLENLPIGHYTVIATMNGTSVYTYLAVMKPLTERDAVENTPFAADTASTWFAPDEAKLPGLIKLWKLAGIEWVRDRVGWAEVSNENNDISMGRYGRQLKAISDAGIKIMADINGAPTWMKSHPHNVAADNLLSGYQFAKNIAEANAGNVDLWEVLNENDGGGSSGAEPGDIFTAFQKAMYIGFRDAKVEEPLLVSSAGAASPYLFFNENCLENDLLQFSDVYNYHFHSRAVKPIQEYYPFREFVEEGGPVYPGTPSATPEEYWDERYNTKDYPVWIGESGIGIEVPLGTEMPRELQGVQARYLVTSTVESLSQGTDMHFWFLGTCYQENINKWGYLSEADTPLAAVVSQSVMTDTLKKGQYIGRLPNQHEHMRGYWFDSGKANVLVLYATEGTQNISLPLGCDNVKMTGMMGKETQLSTNQGTLDLTISLEPIYLTVEQEIPEQLIDRNGAEELSFPKQQELTPAERVVLFQKYSPEATSDAKYQGYTIRATDKVRVEVYNFNDTPMTGTISGFSEESWKVVPETAEVSLEPMGVKMLEFSLEFNEKINTENEYITFVGDFDGQKTTKSASSVHARNILYPLAFANEDNYGVNVQVFNDTKEVFETDTMTVSYAGKEYQNKESITVQPGEIGVVFVPIQGEIEAYTPYPLTIDLTLKNGLTAHYESDFELNILNQGNSTNRKIDLAKNGKVLIPQVYKGEADLSGTISVGADSEQFYLEATIIDDKFSQKFSDYDMWNGDSIQFGIAELNPEGSAFSEFGFGLTPKGPQLYRYRTLNEKLPIGLVTPSYISIKRDEKNKKTHYAVSVPWSEMLGDDFDLSAFKISMLVNENDDGGRAGYIEWGSGIGDAKNPGFFKDVVWTKND